MPVNFSVKNVPDHIATKIRLRAKANNRSLQGELLALLHDAVMPAGKLSAVELLQMVRWTASIRMAGPTTNILAGWTGLAVAV